MKIENLKLYIILATPQYGRMHTPHVIHVLGVLDTSKRITSAHQNRAVLYQER